MKSIILTIIALVVFGGAALLFYTQQAKIAKEQAIGDCLQTGRIQQTKPDGTIVTIPENYWYTYCMKAKGYEK